MAKGGASDCGGSSSEPHVANVVSGADGADAPCTRKRPRTEPPSWSDHDLAKLDQAYRDSPVITRPAAAKLARALEAQADTDHVFEWFDKERARRCHDAEAARDTGAVAALRDMARANSKKPAETAPIPITATPSGTLAALAVPVAARPGDSSPEPTAATDTRTPWPPADLDILETAYEGNPYITRVGAENLLHRLQRHDATAAQVMTWFCNTRKRKGGTATNKDAAAISTAARSRATAVARGRWSHADLDKLEARYKYDVYISREHAEQLAAHLECGATASKVQIWFQNARQRRRDTISRSPTRPIGWTREDLAILAESYHESSSLPKARAELLAARLQCGANASQVIGWFEKKRKQLGDIASNRICWTHNDTQTLEAAYQSSAYVTREEAETLIQRLECKADVEQVKRWFACKRQLRGDASQQRGERWQPMHHQREMWSPEDTIRLENAYQHNIYISRMDAEALASRLAKGATAERVRNWFKSKRQKQRRGGELSRENKVEGGCEGEESDEENAAIDAAAALQHAASSSDP